MKLNIGCGENIKGGWINLDKRKLPGAEQIDVGNPLPYGTESIDQILAEDILEHFPLKWTDQVFGYWIRVLKKGRTIELFVPNLDEHIDLYLKGKVDLHRMSELLYGKQDYTGNFHYRCFNVRAVRDLFKKHGLDVVKMATPGRGIRAIGRKL